MTAPTITVDGDERLAATAHHAADELADMESQNRAVGEIVRARVVGKVPRVSGRLAGSVKVSAVSKTDVVVSSDLVYAPVINYGWPARNIVAQPFMQDGLRDSEQMATQVYEQRVASITADIKGA